MADDERSRLSRRNVLAHGAIAAGLVWSKPVVRSVGRLGAVGTPEPPTSATNPPTSTTYTFGGPSEGTFVNLPQTEPGCVLNGEFDFPTNVDGVGPATVAENICVNNPAGPVVLLSGSFTLTANGGTFVGTFTGTAGPPDGSGAPAHHDITITTGTGIFAGATGTATLDGTGPSQFPVVALTLSGSVTVPA